MTGPSLDPHHFQLFTFGSDVELRNAFGSMEKAAEMWRTLQNEFMDAWDLSGMPSAWWHFEPGIPEDLRAGPHAIVTTADADAWERIEQGRRRFLVSLGIDPAAPGRRASGER